MSNHTLADDDPQLQQLPLAIQQQVEKVFDEWERRPPDKAKLPYKQLLVVKPMRHCTIGDHEQAREFHRREALDAIRLYVAGHWHAGKVVAAWAIARARYHASASLLAQGVTPTEEMLPFGNAGGAGK